jgi:hypothetical protein
LIAGILKAIEPGEKEQVLGRAQVTIEQGLVRDKANVPAYAPGVGGKRPPTNAGFSGSRSQQRCHDAQQRALPGPIGPDQRDKLALPYMQIHVTQDGIKAVILGKTSELDHDRWTIDVLLK